MPNRMLERELDRFTDQLKAEVLNVTEDKFKKENARLNVKSKLAKQTANVTVRKFVRDFKKQEEIAFKYAEEVKNKENPDFEYYKERYLENHAFYQLYQGNNELQLRQMIEEELKETGQKMAPLIQYSEEEDFWKRVQEHYNKEEAKEIFQKEFNRMEDYKPYMEQLKYADTRIGGIVMQIIDEAHHNLEKQIKQEIEQEYN